MPSHVPAPRAGPRPPGQGPGCVFLSGGLTPSYSLPRGGTSLSPPASPKTRLNARLIKAEPGPRAAGGLLPGSRVQIIFASGGSDSSSPPANLWRRRPGPGRGAGRRGRVAVTEVLLETVRQRGCEWRRGLGTCGVCSGRLTSSESHSVSRCSLCRNEKRKPVLGGNFCKARLPPPGRSRPSSGRSRLLSQVT